MSLDAPDSLPLPNAWTGKTPKPPTEREELHNWIDRGMALFDLTEVEIKIAVVSIIMERKRLERERAGQ